MKFLSILKKENEILWRIKVTSAIIFLFTQPSIVRTEGGEGQMEVTDVRIRKVAAEGKMKAIVSVTFDNEFVVHDIKIIEGQNGLFIAMPSRKMGEGDFRDIAHPINSDTRTKIQEAIFTEYEKVNEESEEEAVETISQASEA
ncbi:DNA-binding protein SpoVG, cell septation regulator [Natronincola peptidivorans]|uniref:Putative septation protein SpoVG n=2 Tax=Natronincola peptidivorans TaxID=426128 RepID=A0A1I0CSX8_9FIRM|nr:DNA-binding protein SpoVG, cell septation regulator [Natronincola peptidivorans]